MKTTALFCLLLMTSCRVHAPATLPVTTGRQFITCPLLTNSPDKWKKVINYLRMTTVSNRRMTERQVLRLFKDLACATAGNLDQAGRDASEEIKLYASVAASIACLVAVTVNQCLQRCFQVCPLPPAASTPAPAAKVSTQM